MLLIMLLVGLIVFVLAANLIGTILGFLLSALLSQRGIGAVVGWGCALVVGFVGGRVALRFLAAWLQS